MVRSSEVLPAPDGPTIAIVSAPSVSAARRSNARRGRAKSMSEEVHERTNSLEASRIAALTMISSTPIEIA